MATGIRRTVTAAAMVVAIGAWGASPSQAEEVLVEYVDGVRVGVGYDAMARTQRATAISATRSEDLPAGESVATRLELIRSQFSLRERVEGSVSAKYRSGLFSASAKAEYFKAVALDKKSVAVHAYASLGVGAKVLEAHNPELSAAAKRKLRADPLGFFELYGQYYVAAILRGGEFHGVLRVEASSRKKREDFSAEFEAGNFAKKASGEVSRALETMVKEHKTQIRHLAEGGKGFKVSNTIKEMVEAPNRFLDAARAEPGWIYMLLKPYTSLPSFDETVSEGGERSHHAIQEVIENFYQYEKMESEISELILDLSDEGTRTKYRMPSSSTSFWKTLRDSHLRPQRELVRGHLRMLRAESKKDLKAYSSLGIPTARDFAESLFFPPPYLQPILPRKRRLLQIHGAKRKLSNFSASLPIHATNMIARFRLTTELVGSRNGSKVGPGEAASKLWLRRKAEVAPKYIGGMGKYDSRQEMSVEQVRIRPGPGSYYILPKAADVVTVDVRPTGRYHKGEAKVGRRPFLGSATASMMMGAPSVAYSFRRIDLEVTRLEDLDAWPYYLIRYPLADKPPRSGSKFLKHPVKSLEQHLDEIDLRAPKLADRDKMKQRSAGVTVAKSKAFLSRKKKAGAGRIKVKIKGAGKGAGGAGANVFLERLRRKRPDLFRQ